MTEEKEVKNEKQPKEEMDLIVRIAGVDLDGNKSVVRGLTKIKGIGIRAAKNIATAFTKTTNVLSSEKIGNLTEVQIKKLEEIVLNPKAAGIPIWSLNRQKDIYTGEDKHLVMADLDFSYRTDFQRLSEIKSYRGLRHNWGLTTRGQRTKSTHRGKGTTVGVTKKDVVKK